MILEIYLNQMVNVQVWCRIGAAWTSRCKRCQQSPPPAANGLIINSLFTFQDCNGVWTHKHLLSARMEDFNGLQ
jgi:hypothetical protein